MARIHHRIVGQREQPGFNAVQQGFVVATGQVGTANTVAEQYIAADQYLLCGYVKTNAAGTVAGRQNQFQHIVAQLNGSAIFKKM